MVAKKIKKYTDVTSFFLMFTVISSISIHMKQPYVWYGMKTYHCGGGVEILDGVAFIACVPPSYNGFRRVL